MFGEFRGKLPWSSRALKSWMAITVAQEGKPCCREVVALVVLRLWELGHLYAGCAVLLSYVMLAREQDWVQLRGADVVGAGDDVALLLGVSQRGEKSKTGANQGAQIASKAVGRMCRSWRTTQGRALRSFRLRRRGIGSFGGTRSTPWR